MYKYYSLERPVSIGTYPKTIENPMIGFENFESYDQCVKKEVVANDTVFRAWGYLLFKNPLTEEQIKDYELKDAGVVPKITQLLELPRDIQDEILDTINSFYQIAQKPFKMSRAGFIDIYGNVTLEDINKMIPSISKRYGFISEKEKTPLENLIDGSTVVKSVLDTMEIKAAATKEEEKENTDFSLE